MWTDGKRSKTNSDHAIVVPAGARHNIVNTGEKPLRLDTLFAPPEHRDGIVHVTGQSDPRPFTEVLLSRLCLNSGRTSIEPPMLAPSALSSFSIAIRTSTWF